MLGFAKMGHCELYSVRKRDVDEKGELLRL